MTAWVLGVVLAASGFEVAGSATAGGAVRSSELAQATTAFVHGSVSLRRDLGRAWLAAEGSLLLAPASTGLPLTDLGSRITVGYRLDGPVKAVRLELTPFFLPMSRRASFDWRGNWLNASGPTLAAEVETTVGTAWVAAQVRQPPLAMESKLAADFFAGVDAALPGSLRLELRGASVQYGDHPWLKSIGITVPVFALGAAGRLSWVWNDEVGAMLDFFDYADDPTRFTRFASLERRRTPHAAQLFLEGGAVGQQLANGDTRAPEAQVGGWLDAQGRLRWGALRLFATLRFQTVEHVVAHIPSIPPATTIPANNLRAPALEARLGGDLTLGASKLTPGLLVSVLRPASLTSPGGGDAPGARAGSSVFLPASFNRLPEGKTVSPVLTTRVSLRWDPVPFISVLSEFSVSVDHNRFVWVDSTEIINAYVTVAPLHFQGHLFVQGRF